MFPSVPRNEQGGGGTGRDPEKPDDEKASAASSSALTGNQTCWISREHTKRMCHSQRGCQAAMLAGSWTPGQTAPTGPSASTTALLGHPAFPPQSSSAQRQVPTDLPPGEGSRPRVGPQGWVLPHAHEQQGLRSMGAPHMRRRIEQNLIFASEFMGKHLHKTEYLVNQLKTSTWARV